MIFNIKHQKVFFENDQWEKSFFLTNFKRYHLYIFYIRSILQVKLNSFVRTVMVKWVKYAKICFGDLKILQNYGNLVQAWMKKIEYAKKS